MPHRSCCMSLLSSTNRSHSLSLILRVIMEKKAYIPLPISASHAPRGAPRSVQCQSWHQHAHHFAWSCLQFARFLVSANPDSVFSACWCGGLCASLRVATPSWLVKVGGWASSSRVSVTRGKWIYQLEFGLPTFWSFWDSRFLVYIMALWSDELMIV